MFPNKRSFFALVSPVFFRCVDAVCACPRGHHPLVVSPSVRSLRWPIQGTSSFASVVPSGASGGCSSSVGGQTAVTLQSGAAVAHRFDLGLGSSGTGLNKPPNVRPLKITVAATAAIESTSSTSTPSPVL
jgi:hypothetical protein